MFHTDHLQEGPHNALTKGGRETAKVRNHSSTQEHVTSHCSLCSLQALSGCCPAVLLTTQAADELLSSCQFYTAELHLSFQIILLSCRTRDLPVACTACSLPSAVCLG
jgi:hypothetical protein